MYIQSDYIHLLVETISACVDFVIIKKMDSVPRKKEKEMDDDAIKIER